MYNGLATHRSRALHGGGGGGGSSFAASAEESSESEFVSPRATSVLLSPSSTSSFLPDDDKKSRGPAHHRLYAALAVAAALVLFLLALLFLLARSAQPQPSAGALADVHAAPRSGSQVRSVEDAAVAEEPSVAAAADAAPPPRVPARAGREAGAGAGAGADADAEDSPPLPDNFERPAKPPALPALLAPYYASASALTFPSTYHNAFFNEPYMRHRDTPSGVATYTASNRALPHSFPSPLAFAAQSLSSSLVVGVFCYDVDRIEVILDTWGKYVLPERLMIFSEQSADAEQQRRQEALGDAVVVLTNAGNEGRNVTERRASAWKVLPAVRRMFARHPDSEWYYLVDDDSFPVLPVLALSLATFYRDRPTYSATQSVYLGQSVEQALHARSYYADEEGRDVNLRYHCTGGGVVMNQRLVAALQPHLSSCFVSYASDLTLGLCIQQNVADAALVEAERHFLYAQTVEQAVKKFSLDEDGVWEAAAFHHMREPFISQFGVVDRLESYLRESELRTHSGYLWALHELATLRDNEEKAATRLRVMLLARVERGREVRGVRELVEALLRAGWQPLAFLTQLALDTDVVLVDGIDPLVCGGCAAYNAETHPQCVDHHSRSDAFVFKHVQKQRALWGGKQLKSDRLRLSKLDLGAYDLILTLDPVLAASHSSAALFAFFTRPSCSAFLPKPYHLALHDGLGLLDAVTVAGAAAAPSRHVPFPQSSLYFGAYHALGLTVDPYAHHKRERLLVYVSAGDVPPQYAQMARAQQLRTLWLSPTDAFASFFPFHKLARARLCLFPTGLDSDEAQRAISAAERARMVGLLLASISAGCLVLASEEVARWGLRGERHADVALGGAVAALLGEDSVARTHADMMDTLTRTSTERVYGVAVAMQRAALNAHLLEKPVHLLLERLKQHRDRLYRAPS